MPGPNISHMTMSSPSTTYSGPPPPYSSAASMSNSMSGYISPPESNSRRSTRDDKESPLNPTSLPSIHEALNSTDMSTPAQSHNIHSAPGSATLASFADAPRGPGNPFSQPIIPASVLRPPLSSSNAMPDPSPSKAVPPPPAPPDSMQPPMLNPLSSPRQRTPGHRLSAASSSSIVPPDTSFRSTHPAEPARPGYPFSDRHAPPASSTPLPSTAFTFEHHGKSEGLRNPFAKSESVPYGETVKRHLEVFDAGLALNDVSLPTCV